jgi:hypothetical protein
MRVYIYSLYYFVTYHLISDKVINITINIYLILFNINILLKTYSNQLFALTL